MLFLLENLFRRWLRSGRSSSFFLPVVEFSVRFESRVPLFLLCLLNLRCLLFDDHSLFDLPLLFEFLVYLRLFFSFFLMDLGPHELLPLELVLNIDEVLFRISFGLFLPSFALEPLLLRPGLDVLLVLKHVLTPQQLPHRFLLLFLGVDFILNLAYHFI